MYDKYKNACTATNGQQYKEILSVDFNALYPAALEGELPCGLPVYYEKKENHFEPKLMRGSVAFSHGSLTWLEFINATDRRFIDSNGQRVQIRHAMNFGETMIRGVSVDGYCAVDDRYVNIWVTPQPI